MRTARVACVSLNDSITIHDVELVGIGSDGQLFPWHDSNDAEQRRGGLPAFRAATSMVVSDVRVQRNDYALAPGAFAGELASSLRLAPFADSAIDQRVEFDRSDGLQCGWHGSRIETSRYSFVERVL